MDDIRRVAQKNSKNKAKRTRDALKVVYISSPMKVKTSVSRFRALVQQLTGPHSDISRLMESHGGKDFQDINEVDNTLSQSFKNSHQVMLSNPLVGNSLQGSPATSSEYSISEHSGAGNDIFCGSQMEERLMFSPSELFYNPSEMDVLGSYDDL